MHHVTSDLGDGLSPRSNPIAAEMLREIALHQETAVLLEFRARQADRPEKADLLRRRAGAHRQVAQQLRERLTDGPLRHPSAQT